jgi:beta-mannosidase
MDNHRIDLNGAWTMAVVPAREIATMAELPRTNADVTKLETIGAIVPGNFELDMERAGMIDDPYFGANPVKMQELEDRHIFYARTFEYAPREGRFPVLVFEGLDTVCGIYLNGKLIGETDNMLIPHEINPAGLRAGENEIVVHILPAVLAARSGKASAGNWALKYNYESLRMRKAAHMFGWDIMPRLVSAGIFRPAYIEYVPAQHIKQSYVTTKYAGIKDNRAELELFFEVEIGNNPVKDYKIKIDGSCGASQFSAEAGLWFTSGKIKFNVHGVKFWWPKGYGEPNLYDVTVTLLKNDCVIDMRRFKTGIRTVKLHRTSTTDMFMNGKFHFEINGKAVFILGTNWVPADAYHSRDVERIPPMMELLDDIGCNAVRCWGGNVYEAPLFYDRCDELGIMVWQDFSMACAVYPTDAEFCETIRREAETIVRLLRHHPSIILWAGDNECDQAYGWNGFGLDPANNKITREVLPNVLVQEDPTRPFLPSSPYIDGEAFKVPERFLPENHLWGPRDYYKSSYYKDSLCSLVSETGYHGSPPRVSLEKFISPEKLWPWRDNDEWLIRAASPELADGPYNYRIAFMFRQIYELFGFEPLNLDDFVTASQVSQAEADKFFIELFRCGQPKRSGILWWNLIDGWPQFSDAVVDYYFEKKLAYHYIKQSQQPFIITFGEPSNWSLPLIAVNNTGKTAAFTYAVADYETGAEVLSGNACVSDHTSVEINRRPYSQGDKKIYTIQWETDGAKGRNHYLAGNPPFDFAWYKGFLEKFYAL